MFFTIHTILRKSQFSGSQLVRSLSRLASAFKSSSTAPSSVSHYQQESSENLKSAELPLSADVVIVGGGVAGCSLLYHLKCLGVEDVVLVEKDTLTSGTTWHSGGILWSAGGTSTKVELLRRTRDLASSVLEKESGISTGWINSGSLLVARTKHNWDDFRRWATLSKALGVDCDVLQPSAVKEIYPLMDVRSLIGGVYCPRDGTVEPSGLTTAYSKAATDKGGKIFENCGVTGIESSSTIFGSRQVSGVITEHGRIAANCVVNCAGTWAPCVGALAAVSVPLAAYRHAYVVTGAIDGMRGMPNILERETELYYRSQGGSLIFGGYEAYPIHIENISAHHPFTLYEVDWDLFSPHMEAAINLIPVISKTGIKSTVCGPESYTPDTRPLFGESPELQGFFVSCGYNGSGVMLSGGCGQQLAEWIVHGSPSLDMADYDISRFVSKVSQNSFWLIDRCHEGFRKHFSPLYPHDEPLAGRNVRKDMLHQELQSAGCVYVEEAGWEVPGWFLPDMKEMPKVREYDYNGAKDGLPQHTDYLYQDVIQKNQTFDFPANHSVVAEEVSACRNQAAIFNMSSCGKFLLFGEDALEAANWLFTSEMNFPSGNGINTCALNKRGGIELNLNVSRLEAEQESLFTDVDAFSNLGPVFYFTCAAGAAEHVKIYLRRVLSKKDFTVSLVDVSEQLGVITLQGPKSVDILQQLTPADLTSPTFSTLFCHAPLSIHSHHLHAFCLSPTGEFGWELHTPMSSLLHIYQVLWSARKSFGLRNAGVHTLKALSLEKGYHSWPSDISGVNTPVEAGLESMCSTGKEYHGSEAVARQLRDGVHSRLASFTVEGNIDCKPLHGGEVIVRNDEVVGTVCRAGYSHTLQQHIARGYIQNKDTPISNEFLQSGKYQLMVMGRTVPAVLHLQSPFDCSNNRANG